MSSRDEYDPSLPHSVKKRMDEVEDFCIEAMNNLQRQVDEAFGRIRYLEGELQKRAPRTPTPCSTGLIP